MLSYRSHKQENLAGAMGGFPYISYSCIINTNHLCQNLASIPEAHQKAGLASRPGLKCGMRLTMRRPWEASSTDARRATVRVIRTDEELMIARSVSMA
jgi:acetate kinase